MSHKIKLLQIDTDNPADVQAVMLYGIRAGIDYSESARDRAAHALMQAQVERQQAFIDRRVAESSRRMAVRVYVAACVVFMSATVVFVATLAIR